MKQQKRRGHYCPWRSAYMAKTKKWYTFAKIVFFSDY